VTIDLVGPDIRNSVLAHTVHVLLIGGVVAYGWQAVMALVRTPRSVSRALRKSVHAAWLGVLLLLLIQPNPVPYLRFAGAVAVVLILLSIWDRLSGPGRREELLTSGPERAINLEGAAPVSTYSGRSSSANELPR
jgi:hypothetical protein